MTLYQTCLFRLVALALLSPSWCSLSAEERPLAGTPAKERNVALAKEGSLVTISSFSGFGRNDPNYREGDGRVSGERLNDGQWLNQAGEGADWRAVRDQRWSDQWVEKPTDLPEWRVSRGQRWISDMDRRHPHWAWIRFAGPQCINRVVLHCSSAKNYPLDYRIQISHDGGVTVKDIAVVKNQAAPRRDALAMEVRFSPVVTDNVRVFIERSATITRVDCTQLAEIEVFGCETPATPSARSSKKVRLPKRLLASSELADLAVEESAETVTISSP